MCNSIKCAMLSVARTIAYPFFLVEDVIKSVVAVIHDYIVLVLHCFYVIPFYFFNSCCSGRYNWQFCHSNLCVSRNSIITVFFDFIVIVILLFFFTSLVLTFWSENMIKVMGLKVPKNLLNKINGNNLTANHSSVLPNRTSTENILRVYREDRPQYLDDEYDYLINDDEITTQLKRGSELSSLQTSNDKFERNFSLLVTPILEEVSAGVLNKLKMPNAESKNNTDDRIKERATAFFTKFKCWHNNSSTTVNPSPKNKSDNNNGSILINTVASSGDTINGDRNVTVKYETITDDGDSNITFILTDGLYLDERTNKTDKVTLQNSTKSLVLTEVSTSKPVNAIYDDTIVIPSDIEYEEDKLVNEDCRSSKSRFKDLLNIFES